jgi:hypothetical protein
MGGGIVGSTGTFVEIEGCYNVADVRGCRWNKPFTAGIAGTTQGDMRYCFNRGDIYSVTGGGYFCAGVAGGFWSLNDSLTPDNDLVPVNEMTGCYTVGRIYTDSAGFRTGMLAGENDSYIHDNVYSMSSHDGDIVNSDRGVSVNNTEMSSADLKSGKGIGQLNNYAAGAGSWNIFYLPDVSGGNGGYPVQSRQVTGGYPAFTTGGTDIGGYVAGGGITPEVVREAVYSASVKSTPLVSIDGLVQNADFYVVPPDSAMGAYPGDQAYAATVRGMGAYRGEITGAVSYRIEKAPIADCTIVAASAYFNWQRQEPKWVRVYDANGVELDSGEYDWRTLYDAAKGTDPVTVNGISRWYDYTNCHGDVYKYDIEVTAKASNPRYQGSAVQAAFRITPKSLAGMGEAGQEDQAVNYGAVTWEGAEWDFNQALDDTSGNYVKIAYTGKPITPTVKSVKYLGRELRLAAADWYARPYDYDYKYVYGNPNPEESNQVSTEPVDVTPPGKPACMTVRYLTGSNFRNYINVFFTIVPADISGVTAAPVADQAYTGNALTPGVSLTHNDIALREGVDYTLAYRNNTAVGTAEIVVTGTGSYSGEKTVPFRIAELISKAAASAVKAQVFTGKALKPEVKLTHGGAALKKGADYEVTYRDNVAPGRAEITVTGKGGFTGAKTLYFKINPAKGKISKLTSGRRSLTVKFRKPAAAQKATALQLRYRIKGASKWKTVNVSAKKSGFVIKHLKKGGRYQVQLRIVRAVKSGGAKGTYRGAWSAVKTSKAVR